MSIELLDYAVEMAKSGGRARPPLSLVGMDSAEGSGMAFLNAELGRLDQKVLEPLTSVTAARDITMKSGAGWVEYTENVFADYGTTGNIEDSIIAGGTTNIPTAQANLRKEIFKAYTFSEIVSIKITDQLKANQIGRNIESLLDTGLRLNFSKLIDYNTYVGISKMGTYGLVNNPNITSANAVNGAGGFPAWTTKTPDEILFDVNDIINETYIQSEYDISGMANHILIDPANYAYIVNRKVSDAGTISILTYLLQNNIAVNQGRSLQIFPSRWCIGAGVGSTNRMVAYVNEEYKVNMELCVPLSRQLTTPSVKSASYDTLYLAQIGETKFLYTQPARYIDGI